MCTVSCHAHPPYVQSQLSVSVLAEDAVGEMLLSTGLDDSENGPRDESHPSFQVNRPTVASRNTIRNTPAPKISRSDFALTFCPFPHPS